MNQLDKTFSSSEQFWNTGVFFPPSILEIEALHATSPKSKLRIFTPEYNLHQTIKEMNEKWIHLGNYSEKSFLEEAYVFHTRELSHELIISLISLAFKRTLIKHKIRLLSEKRLGIFSLSKKVTATLKIKHEEVAHKRNGVIEVIYRKEKEIPHISILDKQEVSYVYADKNLTFLTAESLFSSTEVDHGSDFLLSVLPSSSYTQVLDVGCGWGVIGLSIASRFPLGHVTLIDSNLIAVKQTSKNVQINQLKNTKCLFVSVQAMEDKYENKFDLIVSNPPFHVANAELYSHFESIKKLLSPCGQMYLGIENSYLSRFIKILKHFFVQVEVFKENKSIKYTIIRIEK